MAETSILPAAEMYEINDVTQMLSPAPVVFLEIVQQNLAEMIRIAGSPNRLRPHCKTHKTREIVQMQNELGITKQKCATIAEAEMLMDCGVEDVFLAYQPVGPNVDRVVRLNDKFPQTRFAVAIDDLQALEALVESVSQSENEIGVMLELDPGMNRTGIALDAGAIELYEAICSSPGIRPEGLHWYDGHNTQTDLDQRRIAIDAGWQQLTRLRDQLMMQGFPIPRIVAGGTGSFPVLAEYEEPNLELSPGTVVFYDRGYLGQFPDLKFTPALGILTRVISRQRRGELTLDVGHKSCAADPPAGKRLAFPGLPDAKELRQNEEHLVISTAESSKFQLGDHLIALPVHACPTLPLHEFAYVVSGGELVDQWCIAARNRRLTV